MGFRGVSVCNVDAKGRFSVPTKYRDGLTDSGANLCVMTIDTEDECLLLYPVTIWEEIEKGLQALPSLNRKVRRIQRLLIGHASEVEVDSQGRLLMPTILRNHAKVGKKLMLVGQGKKFEIWSEESWSNSCKDWLEEGRLSREQGQEMPDELSSIQV